MNWDLWRTHRLLDLSLLSTVLVCRNFVSCIRKLKPKKLQKNLKSKSLFFVFKTQVFPALVTK